MFYWDDNLRRCFQFRKMRSEFFAFSKTSICIYFSSKFLIEVKKLKSKSYATTPAFASSYYI